MRTTDSGKTWERIIEFDGACHEIRLVNATQNQDADLYISITTFNPEQEQPQHQVYHIGNKNEFNEPTYHKKDEAASVRNTASSSVKKLTGQQAKRVRHGALPAELH